MFLSGVARLLGSLNGIECSVLISKDEATSRQLQQSRSLTGCQLTTSHKKRATAVTAALPPNEAAFAAAAACAPLAPPRLRPRALRRKAASVRERQWVHFHHFEDGAGSCKIATWV